MNKNSLTIKKMALAAIFLVFGWILPLVTGSIPEICNMLCPMHIPVMLCGFILGPWYGLIIGFITPLTRGFIFGMPTFYPTGISMAFELATYGLITGILYELLLKKSKIKHFVILYFILISSMLAGRIVWGIARVLCGLFDHHLFTWRMFLMGGFVTAWPGIIIQLIVIPILLEVLFQTKILEKLSVNYTNKSLKQILKKVKALMKKQDQLVIAIDGMAASGKTTLANEIAKNNGWATFQSIQGHYNLIFREEEREMKPYCDLMGVSMTPYSSLASGRLSRHPGETSKRLKEDTYAKGKYDESEKEDLVIIQRVEELAKKRNCSMSEISLAWLMSKVTSPVVGATKLSHIDTACKACDLKLTVEEMKYLEECYKPHPLVGVMKENNQ